MCYVFHFIAMFHHMFFRDRRFMKVSSSQFDVWWKLPQGEPTRRGPSSQWLFLYCVLAALGPFLCVESWARPSDLSKGRGPNGHVTAMCIPLIPSCGVGVSWRVSLGSQSSQRFSPIAGSRRMKDSCCDFHAVDLSQLSLFPVRRRSLIFHPIFRIRSFYPSW